jgi:cell division protein FtsL
MEIVKNKIGEKYTDGFLEEPEPAPSGISIPTIREPRDMVYSGSIEAPADEELADSGISTVQSNTRQKRKVSPFTIVLVLFGVAVTIVLYIGNILVVGRLLNQINQLQIKHRQIVNQQELLRAQIIKLSSLERIQQLAQDQLGMKKSAQLPVWIEIDPDQIDEVEEAVEQTEQGQ